MFDPGPQPAVPAVDEHGEVLGHNSWLGAPLQLKINTSELSAGL
jgi:hypothetical protein